MKMQEKYLAENRNRKRQAEDPWATQCLLCVYCGKEIEWNPCCGHPQCKGCKNRQRQAYEKNRQRNLARSRHVGGDNTTQPDMW